MKLQGKLLLGFLFCACLTLVTGLFANNRLHQLAEADTFLYEKATVPMGDLLKMISEMLGKARKNINFYQQNTGLDNVEFRLGEIEHLPVADNCIDVVLSNCVINLSPDKPQVWREVFRVLKPGGKVSVSDLALLQPLPEDIREMAAALVGCVAGAALVEDTRAMLEAAGFEAIVLTPKPDYVRSMQNWNDPLYRQIAEALPKSEQLADYIVSLSIEATT